MDKRLLGVLLFILCGNRYVVIYVSCWYDEYPPAKTETPKAIPQGFVQIFSRVQSACYSRPSKYQRIMPRIVAVSEAKSADYILEAYKAGQRHFGEYFIGELIRKGLNLDVIEDCQDIHWHFVGPLSNDQIIALVSIPGLFLVETVTSRSLASFLNLGWEEQRPKRRLKVFVQINTSGEPDAPGIHPDNATELVNHILINCPFLEFNGFMTLGNRRHNSTTTESNPGFHALVKYKEDICSTLHLIQDEIEISMGTSNDFEDAIMSGSTNIHISSLIFGPVKRRKLSKFI